jgi:hypothetical protein
LNYNFCILKRGDELVYLSETHNITEEIINKINLEIEKYNFDYTKKKTISTIILYTFSNTLDLKIHIFEDQIEYSENPQDKIKAIIDDSIDYLYTLLREEYLNLEQWKNLEEFIKKEIYSFIIDKVSRNFLKKDNYSDFITLLKKNYNTKFLIRIIKKKLILDSEKRIELHSILEYLTILGKNEFQDNLLNNIQEALNFRINKLKSYSTDYFIKNFFMIKMKNNFISEDYNSIRFFYPEQFIKELKNMLISWDNELEEEEIIVQEVKKSYKNQINELKETQSSIDKLKELKKDLQIPKIE